MSGYGISAISEDPKTGKMFEDGKIKNLKYVFENSPKITVRFEMEIGRLYCRAVRNFLNECKFNGMDMDYYEGSGLVSHNFLIKGNYNDVSKVYKILKANQ